MKLRATLIQDVAEYLDVLRTHLQPLFAEHDVMAGMTEEGVLQWIIEEELEHSYYLFARGHLHNSWPHTMLHNRLDASLPIPLYKYTQHYVKAPKLYGDDCQINVSLKGRDLYIEYHAPFVSISLPGHKFNQF